MILKSKLLLSVVAGMALTVGCGKEDKKEEAPATTATDKLETASSLMLSINSALSSVPAGSVDKKPTSLQLASTASANPLCTEHGEPLKDDSTAKKGDAIGDGARLSASSANYPARLFNCLATLTSKDGASVETIQGSLTQTASIFCSVEKAFGKFEYTTAGNDFVAGVAKDVALDSECWAQGAPDGMTSVNIDSGKATLLPESSGFQKELEFKSTKHDIYYKVRFFNKNGIIGIKTYDEGNDPGVGGYAELVLDSTKGVVLVNTVDDRNGAGGADSAYRRVVRMAVKGEMDTEKLTFKSLTSMQGIYANSGDFKNQPEYFSGYTLNGDSTNGFHGSSVSFNGSTFTTNYEGCSGAKTDCTATGLKFTDNKFYSSRTEWAAHRTSGLPICYDGKDLTFAAVPATGAFGVCAQ